MLSAVRSDSVVYIHVLGIPGRHAAPVLGLPGRHVAPVLASRAGRQAVPVLGLPGRQAVGSSLVVYSMLQTTHDGSSNKRDIVLYVLLGLAALLAVVFIVIFCQYCRVYRMSKAEELEGLVDGGVTPEQYEVIVF